MIEIYYYMMLIFVLEEKFVLIVVFVLFAYIVQNIVADNKDLVDQ